MTYIGRAVKCKGRTSATDDEGSHGVFRWRHLRSPDICKEQNHAVHVNAGIPLKTQQNHQTFLQTKIVPQSDPKPNDVSSPLFCNLDKILWPNSMWTMMTHIANTNFLLTRAQDRIAEFEVELMIFLTKNTR